MASYRCYILYLIKYSPLHIFCNDNKFHSANQKYFSLQNKLTKKITWILFILCIVVGLYANNRGLIGLFPIVASASYTIFMFTTKDEQQMRWALVSNLILWFVHDIYIQAYPSALTDVVLSIWTSVQIFKKSKIKSFFFKLPNSYG